MKKDKRDEIAPILSVVIVIVSLFAIVFLKMETRRLGYKFLKDSRNYKLLNDRERLQRMKLAAATRTEHLRSLAYRKLTMEEANHGQIIQMSGHSMAIKK